MGVHAIGTGATELIHIGQAVMAFKGTVDYFINNVFNYPTLAECYKVAALTAATNCAPYIPMRRRRKHWPWRRWSRRREAVGCRGKTQRISRWDSDEKVRGMGSE